MIRLETLIELKSLNSRFSSLILVLKLDKLPCRAIRGSSISIGSTLPPFYFPKTSCPSSPRHRRAGMFCRPPTPTQNIQQIGASDRIQLVLHLSKLVIWGSSWSRGFRFHQLMSQQSRRPSEAPRSRLLLPLLLLILLLLRVLLCLLLLSLIYIS